MRLGEEVVKSFNILTVLIKRNLRRVFLLIFPVICLAALSSSGQTPTAAPSPSPKPSLERHFFKNIFRDQREIWTSPLRLHEHDMRWFAPLGAATAALFLTDRYTGAALDGNNARLNVSHDISKLGSGYTLSGAALAFYLLGKAAHNSRAKETGLLTAEALIDGTIVAKVLKIGTQRPRPLEGERHGAFFDGGNSFPSGHSVNSWAFATVIAEEYGKNHPWVRYAAYGLAAAVSLSRYTGRNHFPGDILVGGFIGYGVGHYVYLRHHDTDLDLPAGGAKKTTRLEKYFPLIAPHYEARSRNYGLSLAWNF